jgi:hypothetical protein
MEISARIYRDSIGFVQFCVGCVIAVGTPNLFSCIPAAVAILRTVTEAAESPITDSGSIANTVTIAMAFG